MPPREGGTGPYFSDRHDLRGAPVPDIGVEFWSGLARVWTHLKSEGFLVAEWGSACGGRVRDIGVDSQIRLRLDVEIGMRWENDALFPPPPPSNIAIDVVEFLARVVQKPQSYEWHDTGGWFGGHRDFWDFSREAGLEEYSALVNGLFRTRSHPFALSGVKVVRRGDQEFEAILQRAWASTGDAELDRLIELARTSFFSANPETRAMALEKAWDALERAKTVLDPKSKSRGIGLLLGRASRSNEIQAMLEKETRELTDIGNEFQIRHHEVRTIPVSDSSDRDYLFLRAWALLNRLLPGLTSAPPP
jgi:hypothetical protein